MARPTKEQELESEKTPLQLHLRQMVRTTSIFNENQAQLIWNSTPRKWRYKRPGKGGGQWDYVRAGYIRRQLDSLFGYNWDFIVETSVAEVLDVATRTGVATVKGYVIGRILDEKGNHVAAVQKGDYGRAEVKFMSDKSAPDGHKLDSKGNPILLDFGNDVKAAATDCFKRCAARFGISSDVYDPNEFFEVEVIGSETNTDRAKNQQKLIDKAKSQLESGAEKVGGENGKN